jgi:hypothetical protein
MRLFHSWKLFALFKGSHFLGQLSRTKKEQIFSRLVGLAGYMHVHGLAVDADIWENILVHGATTTTAPRGFMGSSSAN